jgi:nucleoside diphosphate kinase
LEHPDLPALNDAIEKSKLWMDASAGITDGLEFNSNIRRHLSVALHHLAIEHHQAIHTLVHNDVWGSAFALLRPQIEAYVRGMWYGACANDEELKNHFRDIDPPPFKEQVKQLIAVGAVQDNLMQIHTKTWRELCGFTHGGIAQVRNRLSQNEIATKYALKDVENLIHTSAVITLAAYAGMARVLDSQEISNRAVTRYEAIYGATPGMSLFK